MIAGELTRWLVKSEGRNIVISCLRSKTAVWLSSLLLSLLRLFINIRALLNEKSLRSRRLCEPRTSSNLAKHADVKNSDVVCCILGVFIDYWLFTGKINNTLDYWPFFTLIFFPNYICFISTETKTI